jgi:hypothetical protein
VSDQLGRRLAARVAVNFVNFEGDVRVEPMDRTDWASVTFTGARHHLRAVIEGPGAVGAAADFLAVMGELDLPMPGHIVAEIALVSEERRDGGCYACLELEALTIDDC